MNDKIIQIIPAPSNMWAKWEPVDGKEEEPSPIVCLALMENECGFTYVTPMTCFESAEIENVTDFDNFGGIVFSKGPIAEKEPVWHDAKTDPPKAPGVYYGKKDDTNSMYPCYYSDGTWVLDTYRDQTMDILQWAECTDFRSVDGGD